MNWSFRKSEQQKISHNGITAPRRKASYLFALAAAAVSLTTWLNPDGVFKAAFENDFIKSLKEKLAAYNKHLPEERLYLQTDKPFYEPGDDIWFAGFVRDGQTLKPSEQSDIVYVELISPKGTVEKKLNLVAKNGKVSGDFSLDNEAPGGLYKIKAYTNWMLNSHAGLSGDDNCFVKELQVQDIVLPNLKMKLEFERKAFGAGDQVIARLELNSNENKPLAEYKIKFVANVNGQKLVEQADMTDADGMRYIKFNLPKKLESSDGVLNVMIDYNGSTESISRSIPILLNKVKLNFFPEGGDLVCGLENNVAFSALNEFDKPADIEGVLLTEKGSRVGTFSSYHQGMGAFKFNPQPGEKYLVKITKPEGVTEQFVLPEAFERGYLLGANTGNPGQVDINVQTTETDQLALVAQVRGKMVYSTLVDALPGANSFSFPTKDMPAGVCQLTLFDSKGIARAERLVFINRDKQLNVSINTDKEKYQPREKVKMTITVKDERGLPMPANLSMAVVNDQLLSFANDKSGNIASQFLLQQDIQQKIEEPAFYFNKKESKSAKALDYLLMTAGWRRFTWEKILQNDLPPIQFPAQKALIVGSVIDAYQNKPVTGVKIKASTGELFTADDKGRFNLTKLDLSMPVSLTFSAEGYNPVTQAVTDYNQNQVVYLYNTAYLKEIEIGTARENKQRDQMGWAQQVQLMAPQHMQNNAPASHDNLKSVTVQHKRSSGKSEKAAAMQEDMKVANVGSKDQQGEMMNPKMVEKPLVVNNKFRANADSVVAENFDKHLGNKNRRQPQGQQTHYYRARQFATPRYDKSEVVETRSDFRNTIYWNPDIEVGFSGRKTIEFYTSDDITSFRTTVEGIGSDGTVGVTEKNFFTQLPFEMSTKIPVEVATEDLVQIPLTLKNNTNGPLGGALEITAPEGLKEMESTPTVQTIMPGKAKTIYLNYQVLNKPGVGEFVIRFKSCGLSDAFTRKINISSKGFPVQVSLSGQEVDKEYSFEINKSVHGSLKATFNAFPNVVSDLMKGVDGILQEPYGCFEQTSCTAYPNAMVLDYLKNTDSKDSKTLARATDLLDRGYKRLTTFETANKGYEWFGSSPAHEGLTAYGIMEFVDMKKAGQEVDAQMLDRTARWLLTHRDGKGGFARETRALHDFGRISDDILNAYIVYALAEAGYTDIEKEFETSYLKAINQKDPYMLAMLANAASALKQNNKADEALKMLISLQQKDGSFNGSTHSITYSQGQSLTIETTALAILAMLKPEHKNAQALNNAVNFLVGTRSGSGVFSSTQGTILALKCLTEFAKYSKKTTEDGTIHIYVDGKKVASRSYKAGDKGTINMDGLEEFIKGDGKHTLKVKYEGVKNPLPYSVAVNWNTTLPLSNKECSINLVTKLASKTCNVGETLRLSAVITNKTNAEVPSTMAIIGIPGGLTAQPWQLKELQEKHVFDYYEIKGNNIAVYYRGLAANDVKEINLDLKAEMPGEYDAPASSAYLYYTNEFKTWAAVDKVSIKKTAE